MTSQSNGLTGSGCVVDKKTKLNQTKWWIKRSWTDPVVARSAQPNPNKDKQHNEQQNMYGPQKRRKLLAAQQEGLAHRYLVTSKSENTGPRQTKMNNVP